LYGLKQAPKAWYDSLQSFLLLSEYKMGMVDNTLFTKTKGQHLIIIQIYVDDIIFGSTCQSLCDEFANLMHNEFEMSIDTWESHQALPLGGSRETYNPHQAVYLIVEV
jgi:hypothetical protein